MKTKEEMIEIQKEVETAKDNAEFQEWLKYNKSELDREFLENYKEELNYFYEEAWRDARNDK